MSLSLTHIYAVPWLSLVPLTCSFLWVGQLGTRLIVGERSVFYEVKQSVNLQGNDWRSSITNYDPQLHCIAAPLSQ